MTVSILLTMNMLVIFYSALDKALAKLGLEDFHIIEHTVTGKMSLLSMNAGDKGKPACPPDGSGIRERGCRSQRGGFPSERYLKTSVCHRLAVTMGKGAL